MRKNQILAFVPGNGKGCKSTNQIAQDARLNNYIALNMLKDLERLPRPPVRSHSAGDRRAFLIWERTDYDKELLDKILKIPVKERDHEEHRVICMDKHANSWHVYIEDIVEDIEDEVIELKYEIEQLKEGVSGDGKS